MSKTLIVITGPTASGKSALAVGLCRRLGCDLISADSRQVYRGIPIVTAMPGEADRKAVCHHLIDMLALDEYYSASCFENDALRLIGSQFSRSDYALVCGGSMMYVDALCNGIDEMPTVDNVLRRRLTEEHNMHGDSWLLEYLSEIDPVYYGKVDRRNIKRVFHAVEISLQCGRPYSSLLTGKRRKRDFRIVKIMLDAPRQVLFDRINSRVLSMVEAGLEREARSVFHLKGLNSLNTVGLKEMFCYFNGEMSFDQAVARIQKNTRVYAKKQLTWYARDPEMSRLDITEPGLEAQALGIIYSSAVAGQKS